MKWLVLVCFIIFGIGVIGFMINIFRGKSLKTSDSSFSPDKLQPYEDDERDDATGN